MISWSFNAEQFKDSAAGYILCLRWSSLAYTNVKFCKMKWFQVIHLAGVILRAGSVSFIYGIKLLSRLKNPGLP